MALDASLCLGAVELCGIQKQDGAREARDLGGVSIQERATGSFRDAECSAELTGV